MILNRLQLLLVLMADKCCVSGHHLTPPPSSLLCRLHSTVWVSSCFLLCQDRGWGGTLQHSAQVWKLASGSQLGSAQLGLPSDVL